MAKNEYIKKTDELLERIIDLRQQGKSISELSVMAGLPSRVTIYRWLREDKDFAQRFDRVNPMHHLKKSEGRPYQMRIMIDQGPKMIGKRMTIPLETYDPKEAMARRDMYIRFLKKQGLNIIGEFPTSRKS